MNSSTYFIWSDPSAIFTSGDHFRLGSDSSHLPYLRVPIYHCPPFHNSFILDYWTLFGMVGISLHLPYMCSTWCSIMHVTLLGGLGLVWSDILTYPWPQTLDSVFRGLSSMLPISFCWGGWDIPVVTFGLLVSWFPFSVGLLSPPQWSYPRFVGLLLVSHRNQPLVLDGIKIEKYNTLSSAILNIVSLTLDFLGHIDWQSYSADIYGEYGNVLIM